MHRNPHFKTVVALDFNDKAANKFKMNMLDADVITGDITDADVKKMIIQKSIDNKVNMISGGPPCQGFSMKRKKLGLNDPRIYLFMEYLRIVEAISPKVFIIENLKSLLSTAGGWFKDEILSYVKKTWIRGRLWHIKCQELRRSTRQRMCHFHLL